MGKMEIIYNIFKKYDIDLGELKRYK